MKKIFVFITFFALITIANASISQHSVQTNQRQAIAIWEKESLTIHGKHRPYSKVKLYKDDKLILETSTSSNGSFTFSVNKALSPEIEHNVVIKAFDRFDRVIKDENGNEDIISKTILPGLVAEGTLLSDDGMPIAGAQIDLYNDDGELLNRFYSDENGNFALSNAPKNAVIKVSGEGIEEKEVEYKGEKNLSIVPEIDKLNPPKITKITEFNAPVIDLNKDGKIANEADSSNNTIIIILIVLFSLTAIFVVWKIKQKK